MVANTKTFPYENFGGGLNFRDDEIKLPIGETPDAQNVEIVKKTGLEKLKGFEPIWDFSLPSSINITEIFNYTDDEGTYRFVAIAYPEILLIDPDTGAFETIYSSLVSTGDPQGFEADGKFFLCDGANVPVVIDKTTVTAVTWPPSYTNGNNDSGNLDQTMLASSTNPTDIGNPGFGVFHANRIFVAGDPKAPRRLYASKLLDFTDFSDNDPTAFNIAFFVDVPTSRPITGLKVISNKHLVIYCDREILLMTGENPPGTSYPQPHFNIQTLNSQVGALGNRLIEDKGDNDHYFVSGNGRVFQLSLTESFIEVKPLGLTEKIFPFLQGLKNETFQRGRLVNYQIRGELLFWLPSTNQRRYPDQYLVLNYGDRPEEPVWSLNKGFTGNFTLKGALISRETNELLLANTNEILKTNTGSDFNGEAIETFYQLATLDYGAPDNNKEIVSITVYGRSLSGATITFQHLWENGQSGSTCFTINPSDTAKFGTAVFGTSKFSSSTGEAFERVNFQIINPKGKIFKSRIRHTSATEDFTINSISFNYKVLGKD